jgi:hypothetical protein
MGPRRGESSGTFAKRKFCSPDCGNKARILEAVGEGRLCAWSGCGKPLVRHVGEAVKHFARRICCDYACSRKYIAEKYRDKPKSFSEHTDRGILIADPDILDRPSGRVVGQLLCLTEAERRLLEPDRLAVLEELDAKHARSARHKAYGQAA